MSALYLDIIKKENFTIDKVAEILNNKNPINDSLIYTTGKVKRRKGGYEDCNSDGGAEFPFVTELVSPIFNTKDYTPDFFYLIVTQKVNMSSELFDYFEEGKEKAVSCENKGFSAAVRYLPVVEGKNLITNGKKIPSKLKKKSAIVSIVLGQGVYYELLQKSVPMKRYTQYSIGNVVPNVNYTNVIDNIDCSQIGFCRMANPIPS